jgi:hypothetical protein
METKVPVTSVHNETDWFRTLTGVRFPARSTTVYTTALGPILPFNRRVPQATTTAYHFLTAWSFITTPLMHAEVGTMLAEGNSRAFLKL